MESTIRSNVKSSYGEDYEVTIAAELASYGFTGNSALYDYCLNSIMEKELNFTYVTDNFDALKANVEAQSPRTISIITMTVSDAENLTDEEKTKKENIDKEIKDGSFESAATAFSDDTTTAPNKGFYGYVDKSDTTLDTNLLDAAIKTEKGKTSDWVTVVNESTGTTTLYRVYVNETDVKTLFESEDEDVSSSVLYAFLEHNANLDLDVIDFYASKLKIEFKEEDAKKKIDAYINSMKVGE